MGTPEGDNAVSCSGGLNLSYFSERRCSLYSHDMRFLGCIYCSDRHVSLTTNTQKQVHCCSFLDMCRKCSRISWLIMFLRARHKPLPMQLPTLHLGSESAAHRIRFLIHVVRSQIALFFSAWGRKTNKKNTHQKTLHFLSWAELCPPKR